MQQIIFIRLLFPLLLLLNNAILSQEKSDSLIYQPDALKWNTTIYVFGLKEQNGKTYLKIIRFHSNGSVIKDTSVVVSGLKPEFFHPIQFDTLHNYLNLYIQRKDNDKTCILLRLDKSLHLVANLENVEITRINSFITFDTEKLVFGKELYVVRPFSKDSSHHYYLQKYILKDSSKVFEYIPKWQFNFGKQTYHRCHLIAADSKLLYLYVVVSKGDRSGQWILFFDKEKGETVNSFQLNEENPARFYFYSNFYLDPESGDFHLCGYTLPTATVQLEKGKFELNSGKAPYNSIYIMSFDSAGFLKERKENFILHPPDLSREKEFRHFLYHVNYFNFRNNEYSLIGEMLIPSNSTGLAMKTFGVFFIQTSRDQNDSIVVKKNYFNGIHRDSKFKHSKKLVNQYEVSLAKDKDAFFYKEALYKPIQSIAGKINFDEQNITIGSSYKDPKSKMCHFTSFRFNKTFWMNKELASFDKVLRNYYFAFEPDKAILFIGYESSYKLILQLI